MSTTLHYKKNALKASSAIKRRGRAEILSLPMLPLTEFLLNRYIRGTSSKFTYCDSNPKQIDPTLPATILLHADQSNQGQWIPLIRSIRKSDLQTNLFTLNYSGTGIRELTEKIREIKALYKDHPVTIHLIGHSLGGICAAEYAFSKELWIEGTHISKVITIASRLKNLDNPDQTPYYPYCYPTLKRLDALWKKIEQNQTHCELYTIAAEDDWLVPLESTLIAPNELNRALIPNKGHVLIASAKETQDTIIEWLL